MSRKPDGMGTIRTEGGLLSRALLERVAAGDKTLAGMAPEAYHLAPNEKLGEAITRSWNRLVGAWEAFSEIVTNLPADEKRSEEHTSELQSLMRISYAVFCLTTKKHYRLLSTHHTHTEN